MLENLTDEEIVFLTEMVINKGMYQHKKESLHYKWYHRIAMELLEETIKRKEKDQLNPILLKYTPKLIEELMEAKLKTAPKAEQGS